MLSGRSGIPVILIGLVFIVLGCSGSGQTVTSANLELSGKNPSASQRNSHLLWGLWDVTINSETLEMGVTPLRGAMFTCNVTQFMQPPSSPINMISFELAPGSDPALGHFIVDVTLKHPFPGMHFYNGFDVRGVFLADGVIPGEHDPTVIMSGPGDSLVYNPDGFTRFWNYSEFTSYQTIFGFTYGKLAPPNKPICTVNPYKYFADGLGVEDLVSSLDPTDRGIFTAGSANSRRYDIQFKMAGSPVFDFNYAVDASWDEPDIDFAPEYPAEAFPPGANCAEAYDFVVSDAGSTAYYVDPDIKGGELILDLEIFDHQGAFNPSGVPGEVSAIWLEGEVLPTPIDVLGSAVIKPGSTSASSVFEVTLSTLDLTHSGVVDFMATIENKDPSTYEPQVTGGEFFAYPDAKLSAYFKFEATVSDVGPELGWPTEPVLIDPDQTIVGTRFAVDIDGVVHALYTDGYDVFWSWSDDYGWTWTNEPVPAYTTPSLRELNPHSISMDSAGNYVYAVLAERDQSGYGFISYLKGLRLDITNPSAGWSNINIWTLPGYFIYQNIEGAQLSVADDGGIMVFAIRYQPATFDPYYSYSTTWSSLEDATPVFFNTNIENGYETYTYLRHTIQLVADSLGNFYVTLGGNFNDYDSSNGGGSDYGNTLVRYDKSVGRWRFIQTSHHDESVQYWLSLARGLAIDDNDNIHWVFEYSYDNFTGGGNPCYYYEGDFFLCYATGPASGDHTGMTFSDPIDPAYFYRDIYTPYDCAWYDAEWDNASIGVLPDGSSIVIAYQSGVGVCEVEATRNDGSGWSAPVNIEGPGLYGYDPYGRMHPDGWFLLTFTDTDFLTSDGSHLPYFVAWQ